MRLFDRSPGIDAATYAEAQGLVDDGLERSLVLELYPDDAAWLAPLLSAAETVRVAAEAEQPSFFFEATLKAKFLAAAAAQQASIPSTVPVPLTPAPSPFGRLRAAAAGAVVLTAAGLVSFVSLGFITADTSVPGDWNYVFRRGNERIDSNLSTGKNRIDIQLSQTEQRVREIRQQVANGTVRESDLQRLQGELGVLAQAVSVTPPSPTQREKLNDIRESSVEVLTGVSQRQAALAPAVQSAIESVNIVAVAAGLPGGTTTAVTPVATATATAAAPTMTATAPTATATTPSETPTATSTAAGPSVTPSVTPTAPATSTPTPTAGTATPSATPESDTSAPAR